MRMPWRDRHGRFLPLKAALLPLCLLPGVLYGFWWAAGMLSGRAVNDVIHATGLWSVRFLLISLAVTPLARLLDWPNLLTLRRMVGVTAAAYAVIHLLLYVVEQKFNLLTVASEIIQRFYLTIGFIALAGLIALAATSTDRAIKRLGRTWKRLHRLAYPIGLLALWHYALQSKANVGEAMFAAGLFTWLMIWRVLPDKWRRPAAVYPALAVLVAVLTAGVEFGWYALATGIDPWRVLSANQSIDFGLRPAHWVFVTALGVAAIIAANRLRPRRPISASRPSGPIRARTARGS